MSGHSQTQFEEEPLDLTRYGDLEEAIREHYEELLDAERRALSLQEFVAYTLDEFGERMSSQWKAHARSLLAD